MNNKKVKIGLIFLILFVSIFPIAQGKVKYKHGKSAEFSFIYESDALIPLWDNLSVNNLDCTFLELDGAIWNILDTGFTDESGYISFYVKKNTQYKLTYLWNEVLEEIIIENPSALEVVELSRKGIGATEFWLNTSPIPELMSNSEIDIYYWNTTLSDWVVVSTGYTDGAGWAYFYGLIMGSYSFDKITTYDLPQGTFQIYESVIYIEPILFPIRK